MPPTALRSEIADQPLTAETTQPRDRAFGLVLRLHSVTEPATRAAVAGAWKVLQPWRHLDLLIAAMVDKLAERDREPRGYPGWRVDPPAALLDRLREEVAELEQAIATNAPTEEIWREAADVANFAAFIADNVTCGRPRPLT